MIQADAAEQRYPLCFFFFSLSHDQQSNDLVNNLVWLMLEILEDEVKKKNK